MYFNQFLIGQICNQISIGYNFNQLLIGQICNQFKIDHRVTN